MFDRYVSDWLVGGVGEAETARDTFPFWTVRQFPRQVYPKRGKTDQHTHTSIERDWNRRLECDEHLRVMTVMVVAVKAFGLSGESLWSGIPPGLCNLIMGFYGLWFSIMIRRWLAQNTESNRPTDRWLG